MPRHLGDILDELLVLRAQGGDDQAFAALVRRWQPRLWRHAWRLSGRADAASDIVQEAWLAIVRGLRRLDDPARFASWAYRIVSHKSRDWIRRQQRRRRLDEAARNEARTGETGGDHAMRDGVVDAIDRLPDPSRAILALHYLEGRRIAEIATILDVPPGTVKSRLHHARHQLKQLLERSMT
jgi:RNA polymerase sigma-70 factor (ECF subfamily)